MATPAFLINNRYQLGEKVGQGGMGVVYRAYDIVTKRPVALKSMRGVLNSEALELFSKEWTVLAQLSHPNIVDVLDTGEFEQDGERRPFFVMPFLPGVTLEKLMQNSSPRLTLDRVVGIASQTCRGLQAAHERGVVHRDLKPSNIFVMDDDAVKIIDFGIVHLVGGESIKGLKGTLQYMAPEQIELKPSAPASDVFSLAVVCYEALTGRKPFSRKTDAETAEAVRQYIPPPICELNPLVSQLVSRVIHKAMAKDPWHRFSSAREYSETLKKALNGESIDRFDQAKIQPRIDRAKRAQAEGDHQFASEILTELEAEGNIDPEMSLLRIQIDQAIRQKSIRQLMDGARTRLEEDEFPLALQKIQEVLEIDPDNPDAISLRNQIDKQRSQRQTENWFRLVEQHLHQNSFGQAKQGLQEILKLNPNDGKARELLVDVDRREQDVERLRNEKEQLYQSALGCYQKGEVTSALTKLERILELTRRSADSAIPERDAQIQDLYNKVRTEKEAARSAYAEGRRYLADRNFDKALELCNDVLKKSPGDQLFQALKLEIEEQVRQEQSAFIAEVSRRADAEPDLDRRVNILKEAAERYPEESHLQQSLRLVRERRDLVNSIVGKAQQYEERGQFNEALSQFDILRNIYAQYPGIEFETERLKRRRNDQVREESKSRWVEQIDRHIALGDYVRARDLVRNALAEFPDDRELAGLEKLAESALKRAAEAEEWLQRGQKLCFDRQFGEGLDALQKAASLDNRNAVIRSALLNALVEQARSVLGQDWRAAEPLIEQALNIDGGHPLAKGLQVLVLDYKRQEIVNECISQAREMQAANELSGALAKVEEVLAKYPNEVRLVQLRATLKNMGAAPVASPKAPEQSAAPAAILNTGLPVASGSVATPSAVSVSSERLPADGSAFTVDRTIVEPARASQPAPKTPPPVINAPGAFATRIKSGRGIVGEELSRLWVLMQGFARPNGRFSKFQWSAIGAALVIAVLAVSVDLYRHRHQTPPPPPTADYLVSLDSNILKTTYIVDGKPVQPPLRLAMGSHTVQALAEGYKSASQAIAVSATSPKPYLVNFQLEPELASVELLSDLDNAKVLLDEQPADLQGGRFWSAGISLSADHKLSLVQPGKEVLAVSFRAEPGKMMEISPPIKTANGVSAVVVANLASKARVFTTDKSLKGGLKDQPLQPIPDEGLDLNGLTANTEFIADDGKSQRVITIDFSNAPGLTISLPSPNLGTLQVEANVPDADVTIDGLKQRPLRSGRNYYQTLPGTHTIHLSKEGYADAADQKVDLKKGESHRLAFELNTKAVVAHWASLAIESATGGAEVWIDGNRVGNISENGSFRKGDIPAGLHSITLKKADFEDKDLSNQTFTADQTVSIPGPILQLRPFGKIDFRVSPAAATLSYQGQNEAQPHEADNNKSVSVRAGPYAVIVGAGGYSGKRDQILVEPGKSTTIDWALAALPPTITAKPVQVPPPPKLTSAYFQDTASWTREGDGDFWSHKSPDVSWLKASQGDYLLEIVRQKPKTGFKGIFVKKRVEWIIDQKDKNNHIDYTLNFDSLERRVTLNGENLAKGKAVPTGPAESYRIEIDIRADQITIKDGQGKELDRYQRPNQGEPLGKFGFKGDVELVVRKGP